MHHRILFLLLSAAALCFADDVAAPADSASAPAQETATASVGQDTLSGAGTEAVADAPITADEPDSVAIYRELIKQEEAGADFGANFVGMAFSSALMGAGVAFAFTSSFDYILRENRNTLLGLSAISLAFALPTFFSNVNAYGAHKKHAERRDAYRDALERRLERDATFSAADDEDDGAITPEEVENYRKLIKREADQARYGANIFGIAFSGILIGAGIGFLVSVPYVHDPDPDDWLDLAPAVAATFGFMSLSLGVPVFAFNIYAYHSHKKHAARRDAYRDELERRLGRKPKEEERSSAQVLFVPTVDVANSGAGLNLAVLF